MAFDFPSSGLTVGQIVTGPNNIQYKWDGTKWVAATASGMIGGPGITISDTAPASPSLGNLWFDSVGLQTYIWYTDPNSSQWTPILSVTTALGNYLPLTGGTLTGPGNLTVNGLTTVSGGLEVNSVQPTGAPSAAYAIGIDAPAGNGAFIKLNASAGGHGMGFQTQTAGSVRWIMNLGDGTSESGSNAGSNFVLQSYSDTGVSLGSVFTINRASSNAYFSAGLNCGQLAITSSSSIAYLDKTSNGQSSLIIGQYNGNNRWALYLGDSTSETGSDAGSNFGLAAVHDNGAFNDWVITANRNNLMTYLNHGLTVNNAGIQVNSNTVEISSVQPTFALNKSSQTANAWVISYYNGNTRWLNYYGDSSNEGGSNTGSNWYVVACNDAGSYNLQAIGIPRNTGVVNFPYGHTDGSDIRQKQDFASITGALDLVKQLTGVSYERLARPGRREMGLVAQDVRAILPHVIEECPEPGDTPQDKRIGTDTEPALGINYTQITALLIEAVKTLAAKVELLEAAHGV